MKNMFWFGLLQCLYSIIDMFTGTFLLAYLFRVNAGNVVSIGAYYLAYWLTILILAYLTGFIFKHGRKIWVYRTGAVFDLMFFYTIYVLGNLTSDYMVGLGILYGCTTSFRAFSRNLLTSDLIGERQMIHFQGYVNAAKNLLKITVPFILGLILSFETIQNVMFVLCVLVIMDFILSFKIKEPKLKKHQKYNLPKYFQLTLRKKEILYIYLMEMFRGLALEGVLNVVVVLYIVHLFQTNFNLGGLTSFFAIATFSVNYLFGRYCHYEHFVKVLSWASLLAVSVSLLFTCFPAKETFIIYNLTFETAARLLLTITTINMFNVSNLRAVKRKFKVEYFVVRELFLNVGRVIGAFMLIGVGMAHNFDLLRYFLLFLTIGMGIMGYYSILLNRVLHNRKECNKH